MTDREIMQQALRVIKQLVVDESDDAPALQGSRMRKLGIEKALRERLAQPEQEPVAWGVFDGPNLHDMFFSEEAAQYLASLKGVGSVVRPLTTPPAAAQPAPVQPEQEPVPENFMDALKFDVAARDAREWERVDMREHAEGNLGIGTAPPAQPAMFGPMGTVGDLFDKHVIANGSLDKGWIVYVEKNT